MSLSGQPNITNPPTAANSSSIHNPCTFVLCGCMVVGSLRHDAMHIGLERGRRRHLTSVIKPREICNVQETCKSPVLLPVPPFIPLPGFSMLLYLKVTKAKAAKIKGEEKWSWQCKTTGRCEKQCTIRGLVSVSGRSDSVTIFVQTEQKMQDIMIWRREKEWSNNAGAMQRIWSDLFFVALAWCKICTS